MKTPLAGWLGGLVFLVAIFLPADLLVVGALPFWDAFRQRLAARHRLICRSGAAVGAPLDAARSTQ